MTTKQNRAGLAKLFLLAPLGLALMASVAHAGVVAAEHPTRGMTVRLAAAGTAAPIIVSDDDYPAVKRAANLFADDVMRVSGHRSAISSAASGPDAIIAGTLGHSAIIDRLYRSGKLKKVAAIKGHWEATLTQYVENPMPGVKHALVIAGSDRRGTAYGLMSLSETIGVSPWYWWADVPAASHPAVYLSSDGPGVDMPGVKYRGIFINDEDWGLIPWVKTTFDPAQGNIGPKTYEKIFELMLRLRLNYLWPAMHGVSTEFGAIPENARLADAYGIVMGSSHCEPMLFNNIHWNEKEQGNWDYTVNKPAIASIWEKTAKERSDEEAVWTLGIRGIHDAGMEGPKDTATRMATLKQVFGDQLDILDRNVTKNWGPVSQIFVPYKEVLPIYDAGLEVPPDATLVWVDDNFGYIRRLSSPAERKRPGGSGVYWHMSYYGGPHSYTWINTTAPALMWEELHKAWDNDAQKVWVVNVGDIKPMEIGIDYFSKFSWAPQSYGPDSQPKFLTQFAARNFGSEIAPRLSEFLTEFYRLGTIHKPELMNRAWALSLTPERAATLRRDYTRLLEQEEALAKSVPSDAHSAYFETTGFPAWVLATTGLIFLADRDMQLGGDRQKGEADIAALKADLEAQVDEYNLKLEGGKWNGMMPGLVTGKTLTAWSSQVRWPWGEDSAAPAATDDAAKPAESNWRTASSADAYGAAKGAQWRKVEGLGPSGEAMAVLPASLGSSWQGGGDKAPYMQYDFTAQSPASEAYIDFLPTFRTYPGMKLTVAVSVDGKAPVVYDVPGASGKEDENGHIRQMAVQDNYVRLAVALPQIGAGKHSLRITAIDPGVVVDRVWLP